MFLQQALPLNTHLSHLSRRIVIPGSEAAFHLRISPLSPGWFLLILLCFFLLRIEPQTLSGPVTELKDGPLQKVNRIW